MLRFVIDNHPERTRNRSLTENSWLQPALIFSPVLTRVQAWKRYRIRMIATRRRSDYYAGCRPEFATMYPLINNLERRANSPSPSPVTELDRSFAGNERYGYIGCWTTVENFLRTLVPGSWKVEINWGLQFFFNVDMKTIGWEEREAVKLLLQSNSYNYLLEKTHGSCILYVRSKN